MKTAVSLPDPLFEAADRLAERLGLSRSELYANALESYLLSHQGEEITAALGLLRGRLVSRRGLGGSSGRVSATGCLVIRRGDIWWVALPEPILEVPPIVVGRRWLRHAIARFAKSAGRAPS